MFGTQSQCRNGQQVGQWRNTCDWNPATQLVWFQFPRLALQWNLSPFEDVLAIVFYCRWFFFFSIDMLDWFSQVRKSCKFMVICSLPTGASSTILSAVVPGGWLWLWGLWAVSYCFLEMKFCHWICDSTIITRIPGWLWRNSGIINRSIWGATRWFPLKTRSNMVSFNNKLAGSRANFGYTSMHSTRKSIQFHKWSLHIFTYSGWYKYTPHFW